MTARFPPGPKEPVFENISFLNQPFRFLLAIAKSFGDVVYCPAPRPMYFLFHPRDIRRVLHDNAKNYNKSHSNYKIIGPVFGQGLLTSDGELWRQQRSLIGPSFHREKMESYPSVVAHVIESILDGWREKSRKGESIDASAEMSKITLTVIAQSFFSTDLMKEADDLVKSFVTALDNLLGSHSLLDKSLRHIDGMVQRIIDEHRRSPEKYRDLITVLLNARDRKGKPLTDKQIRDEVITMFTAGYETTANALVWSLYLLGQNPQSKDRLYKESQRSADTLPNAYAVMIFKESLRLYPPVFQFSRYTIHEDKVNGYTIPPQTVVTFTPYVTHRHPEFWADPEAFNPERFLSNDIDPYAFIPFSAGPRQCLGMNFAYMEGPMVLEKIARNFEFDLASNDTATPEAGTITIRPNRRILLKTREWKTPAG